MSFNELLLHLLHLNFYLFQFLIFLTFFIVNCLINHFRSKIQKKESYQNICISLRKPTCCYLSKDCTQNSHQKQCPISSKKNNKFIIPQSHNHSDKKSFIPNLADKYNQKRCCKPFKRILVMFLCDKINLIQEAISKFQLSVLHWIFLIIYQFSRFQYLNHRINFRQFQYLHNIFQMASQSKKLIACITVQISQYFNEYFQNFELNKCTESARVDDYFKSNLIEEKRKKQDIIHKAYQSYTEIVSRLTKLQKKIKGKIKGSSLYNDQSQLSVFQQLKPLNPEQNPYKIPMDKNDYGMINLQNQQEIQALKHCQNCEIYQQESEKQCEKKQIKGFKKIQKQNKKKYFKRKK